MITEVVDPQLSAERAINQVLTNNMRDVYDRGFTDGALNLANQSATALLKVSASAECPEELKPGFAEAAKYLACISSGQKYALKAKDKVPSSPDVDQVPKVDSTNDGVKNEIAKAAANKARHFDKKNKTAHLT